MLSCEQVEKFKMSKLQNKEKAQLSEQKTLIKQPEISDYDYFNDTRCEFGFIKGEWMQKLASKKTVLVVNSLTAMVLTAGFFYYTGTLTTLEKHYKFSSTQTGYIGASAEIINMIVSLIVPYYCSKGRLPRYVGFSVFCLAFSYFIYALPFAIYGAGEDALALTEEFGENFNTNSTEEIKFQKKMKELCHANSELKLKTCEFYFN